MRTPILALAGAAALASATSAQAVETITLTGPTTTASTITAGTTIGITLRGFTFGVPVATFAANPGAQVLTARQVQRTTAGIGVASEPGDGQTNQVDNTGNNELLEIAFNTPGLYRIVGATFSVVDSNDTLALYGMTGSTYTRLGFTGDLDGTPPLAGTIPASMVALGNGRFRYTFGGFQGFNSFRLGANLENGDGFALESVTLAAVPEPTTWAMMILGFGVIGGALRRRKRQTPALAAA